MLLEKHCGEMIYQLLKQRTYKKKVDGKQVTICAADLMKYTDKNEQSTYATLRRLTKRKEVKSATYKVKDHIKDIHYTKTYFWIE